MDESTSSVMVQKYKASLNIFEKKLENNLDASVHRCFLSLELLVASERLGIILGRALL